jgi:hypothetical protein
VPSIDRSSFPPHDDDDNGEVHACAFARRGDPAVPPTPPLPEFPFAHRRAGFFVLPRTTRTARGGGTERRRRSTGAPRVVRSFPSIVLVLGGGASRDDRPRFCFRWPPRWAQTGRSRKGNATVWIISSGAHQITPGMRRRNPARPPWYVTLCGKGEEDPTRGRTLCPPAPICCAGTASFWSANSITRIAAEGPPVRGRGERTPRRKKPGTLPGAT